MASQDRRAVLASFRLIAVSDIAKALDLTHRQQALTLTKRDGFPPPAGTVAGVTVWFGDEVEAWDETWERRPGPRRSQPPDTEPPYDPHDDGATDEPERWARPEE